MYLDTYASYNNPALFCKLFFLGGGVVLEGASV